MVAPVHFSLSEDNAHEMGCKEPHAVAEAREHGEELVLPSQIPRCIGPECSDWPLRSGEECRYMDTTYLWELQQLALKNIFLSTVGECRPRQRPKN